MPLGRKHSDLSIESAHVFEKGRYKASQQTWSQRSSFVLVLGGTKEQGDVNDLQLHTSFWAEATSRGSRVRERAKEEKEEDERRRKGIA